MDTYRKRTGYIFSIEDDEASITILRPFSGELTHNGKYIVIYEDAFGGVEELYTLTIQEIAEKYGIDHRNLEDIV